MEASVEEVYNLLDEGKKVKIRFESLGKFLSFKTMLYKHKATMEDAAIILDAEIEPRSIKFIHTFFIDIDAIDVTMFFAEPKDKTKYLISIIE